ncbi:uncharacterized protein LOC126285029 [Schistocerca gregaria]|uniref:uncharacterized protein LOC126285029 n=1 Tax=Schistocerca gregaria TaxID=7010 RepID=UPI00211E1BCC|nr:uncharacterized protein LOC126285029 [Schistocerca gregaria]
MSIHCLQIVQKLFNFLSDQQVHLENVDLDNIVNGNSSLSLSLISIIVLGFQIQLQSDYVRNVAFVETASHIPGQFCIQPGHSEGGCEETGGYQHIVNVTRPSWVYCSNSQMKTTMTLTESVPESSTVAAAKEVEGPPAGDLAGLLDAGPGAVVTLEGAALRHLVAYLYTLQAPQLPGLAPQLLAAADEYGLPELKAACERQMAGQLTVENTAAAAVVALKHSCASLQQAAVAFLKANTHSVMMTQCWADAVVNHPHSVVELTRLIAAPPAETRSISEQERGRRLIQAAKLGMEEELQVLLAAGANVRVRDENWSGWTAPHWAAPWGHVGGSEASRAGRGRARRQGPLPEHAYALGCVLSPRHRREDAGGVLCGSRCQEPLGSDAPALCGLLRLRRCRSCSAGSRRQPGGEREHGQDGPGPRKAEQTRAPREDAILKLLHSSEDDLSLFSK